MKIDTLLYIDKMAIIVYNIGMAILAFRTY